MMLEQLIRVKRRREQQLRQELNAIEQEEAQLTIQLSALQDQQSTQLEALQRLAQTGGVYSTSAFDQLHGALVKLEQQHQQLKQHIGTVLATRTQLFQRRTEQGRLISKNLIEQEKLGTLLEKH